VYYGQCSEICGLFHAFMPIAVNVDSGTTDAIAFSSEPIVVNVDSGTKADIASSEPMAVKVGSVTKYAFASSSGDPGFGEF